MRESEYQKDEALRSSFAETMATAATIAERRIGIRHRLMEIGHITREDTRSIPLDATVNEARTARAMADAPSASPREA
jgi:hypothetical protein